MSSRHADAALGQVLQHARARAGRWRRRRAVGRLRRGRPSEALAGAPALGDGQGVGLDPDERSSGSPAGAVARTAPAWRSCTCGIVGRAADEGEALVARVDQVA